MVGVSVHVHTCTCVCMQSPMPVSCENAFVAPIYPDSLPDCGSHHQRAEPFFRLTDTVCLDFVSASSTTSRLFAREQLWSCEQ